MYGIVKSGSLRGELALPGSKSHTIRAALLAAMAEGSSVVHNPLAGHDGLSALTAARAFGAAVAEEAGSWIIRGTGGKLSLPGDVLDCGNSGTVTNFAMSMAALCEGCTVITGDHQIRARPVIELVRALNELGAGCFLTRPGAEAPPVVIRGGFRGGTAVFSGFNSQVVSSVLLAAPLAPRNTVIRVEQPREKPYVGLTLDWMRRYGVDSVTCSPDYTYFEVSGGKTYRAVESSVPADWSAAAFPLVAALCSPSELVLTGLDFDDAQGDKIVVDHLIAMGAGITKAVSQGRLSVRGGKPLKGGTVIDLNDIPDSLPALAVAACFAGEDTVFTGLAHVRVKETDRVAVMARELGKLGARIETGPDHLVVRGGAVLRGAELESHQDHRVAMALIAAGLGAAGETRVKDAECAAVSFPGFFELMSRAGAALELRG